MMSASDWHMDGNAVSLPNMVSTSDLFDGELFGDELIDIYHSTVAGDNSDVQHDEIPMLDHHIDHPNKNDHPGAHVAVVAAAMDDGLGAFRPSTSFSDLTSLLPPPEGEKGSSKTSNGTKAKVQKKRGSTSSADAPASKRRNGGQKVNRKPPVKNQDTRDVEVSKVTGMTHEVVVDTKALSCSKSINETPDPLSTEGDTKKSLGMASSPLPHVEARSVAVSEEKFAPSSNSSIDSSSISESEFKQIAQAAVSSLISSAVSNKNETEEINIDSNEAVDISTAHIKALTGNNWVAACSGINVNVAPVTSINDPKNPNRARRQNLTPDERARQNRDRNREHARNTRLRKKAYVEELKRALTEMVAQRDAAEQEKRQAAQREIEQREVRFRVIEEFLKLRGRSESNPSRWAAILDEAFSCTLPVTDYRKMVHTHDAAKMEQVLKGVDDVMADALNFGHFLNTFACENTEENVIFQYDCDRNTFFMDDCTALLEWNGSTINAAVKGATQELKAKGLIRCKFSPASNKLISATLSFDTGVILAQLHQMVDSSRTTKDENETEEFSAAQEAADQADAILDSLHLSVPVPSAVTVVPPSSSSTSEASADKGEEMSMDESVTDNMDDKMQNDSNGEIGMTTRRVQRRSD